MKSIGKKLYLFFVLASLYIPLVVLITHSFNNTKYSLMWHGLTSKWYYQLIENSDLWIAFSHSIILGLIASTIACVIGVFACIRLYLMSKKSTSITTLLFILIIIPDIVFAIALVIFFNYCHIPLGFFSLLIAHISFCLPFVVLSINARLKTVDNNLYLAAFDLGASYQTMIIQILFPLLWPAIVSAFLLSFTLSLDDVIISYFVSGPSFGILPLKIYSMVRSGITPEINALCSIIFTLSLVIVLIAYYFTTKGER
jgi:spermidine/putrescine transport system permease protein